MTMGNLRGHKILYNEGWYVVTSSKKALSYAFERSIKLTGEQLNKTVDLQGSRVSALKKSFNENAKSRIKTGKSYYPRKE